MISSVTGGSSAAVVPLACAAIWAHNMGLLATLPLNAASELRQCDGAGRDALMYAASSGSREIVHLVLERGGTVHASDSLGNSALHYAVLANAGAIVADLVQAGAPLDAQNHEGETPLFLAVRDDNNDIVEFLLDCCADPNVVTAPHEVSPLHMASVNMNTQMSRLLIKRGAFVNPRDDVGETPLHWAVCDYQGSPDMIQFLVEEAGVDTNALNEDGETALNLAQSSGLTDVISYLTSSTQTNSNNKTPLQAKVISPFSLPYNQNQPAEPTSIAVISSIV